MFLIDLKDTYFQIPIYPDTTFSAVRPPHHCLPVQGFLFWPFISSPNLHQGVQPDFGVGSQKGNLTPILPGRLVSCCGVVPHLLLHREQLFQLCQIERSQTLSHLAGLSISGC